MLYRTLCAGYLLTICTLALADVDPRSYIDPSLQANVVMGSDNYYNKYFDANGQTIAEIPNSMLCFANRNLKALQDAQSKCSKDAAEGRDAAANLTGAAQAFGAVQDSAETVADNVDVIGNATEKLKDVAGYGERFSKDQAGRNSRQKNGAGAKKWNRRAGTCKSAGTKLKRLLGKVNLAKETADWIGWVCECGQAYCADWENDVLVEVQDTTAACGEIAKAMGQWNELAQQAEGSEEDCQDQ